MHACVHTHAQSVLTTQVKIILRLLPHLMNMRSVPRASAFLHSVSRPWGHKSKYHGEGTQRRQQAHDFNRLISSRQDLFMLWCEREAELSASPNYSLDSSSLIESLDLSVYVCTQSCTCMYLECVCPGGPRQSEKRTMVSERRRPLQVEGPLPLSDSASSVGKEEKKTKHLSKKAMKSR